MSATAATKSVFWEYIVKVWNGYILPVSAESMRILPDSVVLGTAILTMVSLCKSYGVLFVGMLEIMFIQRVLSSFFAAISPIGAGPAAMQSVCQPGFVFPNNMRISLLETLGKPSSFPSPVMFFLTAVVSYMITGVNEFSREIKTLGSDVEARTQVALVMSALFIFGIFLFRFTYGCETFGSILISGIMGLVIGFLVLMQMKGLFGREGVNLLNLPIIRTMDERGKPLYVCAPA